MKYGFIILFIVSPLFVYGQRQNEESLIKAIAVFDKALVDKDSLQLKVLLSNEVSYGHSNGWLQNKSEIIGDLFNGKLTYSKINSSNEEMKSEGTTASVRMDAEIDAVMNGNTIHLKLKVLQVWVWKNKHWELFARQSVKV